MLLDYPALALCREQPSLAMGHITLMATSGSADIRSSFRSLKLIRVWNYREALHEVLLVLNMKLAFIACVFLHHSNICLCLLFVNINSRTA